MIPNSLDPVLVNHIQTAMQSRKPSANRQRLFLNANNSKRVALPQSHDPHLVSFLQ